MKASTDRPFVVVGPTGAGKTALALALAERLGAEVLSADSRQVYRLMDIGTAKPNAVEQQRVHHHLLDLAWPDETFTVADFQRLGTEVMTRLEREGIPFLIAGGSPFYLYALLGNFFLPTAGADPALRQRLESEADQRGLEVLHARLTSIDPISAGHLHPHDRRRIIRALEVWELTGYPRSHFQVAGYQGERFRLVGLQVDREVLRRRLVRRTQAMIRAGLVEEVKGLLQRGYDTGLIPLQSIGYAQVVRLLEGSLTIQEAEDEIVLRSLQFARRQMTWFKRDPRITWWQVGEDFLPEDLAESTLADR